MKRFPLLFLIVFLLGFIACSEDDGGTSGPTIDSPSDLTAVALNAEQIQINWVDNSTYESGFRVQQKHGSSDWTTLTETESNIKRFTATGLNEGTIYSYRVQAFTFNSESEFSNIAEAQTTPLAPIDLLLEPGEDTDRDLILTWSDESTVEMGYQVQRKKGNGAYAIVADLEADADEFIDEGLLPGTKYYYQVRAYIDTLTYSPWSIVISATTTSNTPAAPSELTVVQATNRDQARLNWRDNSSNNDGFIVQRSLSEESGWEDIDTLTYGNTTNMTDSGLEYQTTYYYRIMAYANGTDVVYYSDYSNVAEYTSPLGPPAAPTLLEAETITYDYVTLKWEDNSDDEVGFIIQRHTSSNTRFADIGTSEADTPLYMDEEVSRSMTYTYRVAAYTTDPDANNITLKSAWSNEIEVNTPEGPPVAPRNLDARAPSFNMVSLTWTRGSTNEDGFFLERKDEVTNNWSVINELARGVESYNDGSVESEMWYWYRIRAYNETGNSDYSNVDSVLVPAQQPPQAPMNLRAASSNVMEITLNWTPGSQDEEAFVIEKRADASPEFEVLAEVGRGVRSFIDQDFDAPGTYHYRVFAWNDIGQSPYSNEASADAQETFALISDSFEGYQSGQEPGSAFYTIDYDGPSWVRVTNTQAHDGGQSLQFHDPTNDTLSFCTFQIAHESVTLEHFSCWLKFPAAGWFRIFGHDPNTTLTWDVIFRSDQIYQVRGGAGFFEFPDSPYPVNQWFHFEIYADTDQGVYDFFLDDAQVGGAHFGLQSGTGHDGNSGAWLLCLRLAGTDPAILVDGFMDQLLIEEPAEQSLSIGPVRRTNHGSVGFEDVSGALNATAGLAR